MTEFIFAKYPFNRGKPVWHKFKTLPESLCTRLTLFLKSPSTSFRESGQTFMWWTKEALFWEENVKYVKEQRQIKLTTKFINTMKEEEKQTLSLVGLQVAGLSVLATPTLDTVEPAGLILAVTSSFLCKSEVCITVLHYWSWMPFLIKVLPQYLRGVVWWFSLGAVAAQTGFLCRFRVTTLLLSNIKSIVGLKRWAKGKSLRKYTINHSHTMWSICLAFNWYFVLLFV